MKLSDLSPDDYKVEKAPTPAGGMKLSQLNPDDYKVESPPGPEDKGALDAFIKKVPLGFGDEIAAMAGAIGAQSGGDKRDLMDIYREILPEQRQEFKNAEEQHPYASFAGNVAGAAATAPLLGGLGALGEEGTLLNTATTGMGMGAKLGAIQGLGESNADLTQGNIGDISKAAGDTATGALTGAISAPMGNLAMGAARGVGKAIGGAANSIMDMPIFSKIGSAGKAGLEGTNLVGKQAFNEAGQALVKAQEGIESDIQKAITTYNKDAARMETEADAKGALVDLTDAMKKALQKAKDLPENFDYQKTVKDKLINEIQTQLEGAEQKKTVTANFKTFSPETPPAPTHADELKDKTALKNIENIFQGEAPSNQIQFVDDPYGSGRKVAITHDTATGKVKAQFLEDNTPIPESPTSGTPGQMTGDITTREGGTPVRSVPEAVQLKQNTQQYGFDRSQPTPEAEDVVKGYGSDIRQAIENKVNPNAGTPDLTNPYAEANQKQSDLLKLLNEDDSKLPDISTLQNLDNTTNANVKAQDVMGKFLTSLSKIDPNLAANYSETLPAVGKNFDLAKSINTSTEFSGFFGGIKKGAMGISNLAGKAAGDFGRDVSSVTNASPEWLKTFSSVVAKGGGKAASAVGNIIGNLPEKDSAARNAIMFTLSQNPDYRKAITDIYPNFFAPSQNQGK